MFVSISTLCPGAREGERVRERACERARVVANGPRGTPGSWSQARRARPCFGMPSAESGMPIGVDETADCLGGSSAKLACLSVPTTVTVRAVGGGRERSRMAGSGNRHSLERARRKMEAQRIPSLINAINAPVVVVLLPHRLPRLPLPSLALFGFTCVPRTERKRAGCSGCLRHQTCWPSGETGLRQAQGGERKPPSGGPSLISGP